MAGRTDNSIIVSAPMELIWNTTNDLASWPELFSEYAAVEILERRGETVKFRLTMHPDADGNAWSWVSERTPDPVAHSVRAHRVEPGWFKYMNLFWEYREISGGVEMRWVQEFEMKQKAPLDDAQMADQLKRNTLIQMDRIKRLVEEMAMAGSTVGQPDRGRDGERAKEDT